MDARLPPDAADPIDETGPIDFECPRCATHVTEELYGPCATCRATLRAEIGGQARDVDQADYEPKMNVTPNAVASKD